MSLIMHQADPTVDVPTDDENRLLGALGGCHKRGKIRRAIDQEGGALGVGDAPTIPPFGEDAPLGHSMMSMRARQSYRHSGSLVACLCAIRRRPARGEGCLPRAVHVLLPLGGPCPRGGSPRLPFAECMLQ